ncbi:MAG TPA: Gfo/Idh/MocA family oxidoreductase [bacterium]|nr:Gfo/Idh/MocA family oxidoreductase [bacterium]
MTVQTIHWGILGVANIAVKAVIPAIQHAANGSLDAIASRTAAKAQEAARGLGIARAHGSYEALLADPAIDAIYIPLPNSLHREWTIRCAEAGKHVLCEKPLAPTAAECTEMIAACHEHRVTLMEAFMYRFHPRTERVARAVADGALGEVRLVRAAFTFQISNPRNIRLQPALAGGALYDVGCYAVNVSRMILGEPEGVFACGRIGEHGVDDQLGGVLTYPGGRMALIDCGLALARRQTYEVVGTDARLSVPLAFLPGTADAEWHLTRGADRSTEVIPGVDQYQLMIEHFGRAAGSGARPALPPEDAVGTLRVIEALHRSLRSGRREPVGR